jgi:putative ABC transport system permease protein
VLVNLQGGLLLGLIEKASLLIEHGQADIWVGHRFMNNVDIGGFVPQRWIDRIRKVEGVERAEPYIVMFGQATMPDGRFENVLVVGCEPASLLGNAWHMAEGDARDVLRPDGILVDQCDADRLGYPQIGDIREINGQRARVAGLTHGIVGFTTNPYVFTTLERARQYSPVPAGRCSYFLVKAKRGSDLAALAARLQREVPELSVRDRRTWSRDSMWFWLTRTGVGISFSLAALLGLLVGLAVVAYTLYGSVSDRIKEFGTLKALGADNYCVGRFLLAQALGNAVLGSSLGLLASLGLAWAISRPRFPVVLDVRVALVSVVLSTLVCLAGAWLPYWRIRRIDPASVLRS